MQLIVVFPVLKHIFVSMEHTFLKTLKFGSKIINFFKRLRSEDDKTVLTERHFFFFFARPSTQCFSFHPYCLLCPVSSSALRAFLRCFKSNEAYHLASCPMCFNFRLVCVLHGISSFAFPVLSVQQTNIPATSLPLQHISQE
jgi:hypothetical protein